MWNWGQSPFPHIKASDYSKHQHVEKGTVPNSTFCTRIPVAPSKTSWFYPAWKAGKRSETERVSRRKLKKGCFKYAERFHPTTFEALKGPKKSKTTEPQSGENPPDGKKKKV